MKESYAEAYRSTVAALGIRLGPRAGYSPAAMAAAEQRLGVRLPDSLVAYYEVLGRHALSTSAHQRFRPPSQIDRDGKGLVFLEEEQGVACYGVLERNLGTRDSPVHIRLDGKPWALDCQSLANFLSALICWNAMYRSEATRQTHLTPAQVATLRTVLQPIKPHPRARDFSCLALAGHGVVACLFRDTGDVYALARRAADLRRVEERCGVRF